MLRIIRYYSIAEKKFGQNAKHIKEQSKLDNQARQFLANQNGSALTKAGKGQSAVQGDGGWGARTTNNASAAPAATIAQAPSSKPWERSNGGVGVTKPSEAKPSAPAVAKVDDKAKALHPSWEAARLRKQKESMMGVNPVPGAAKPKKIVFD